METDRILMNELKKEILKKAVLCTEKKMKTLNLIQIIWVSNNYK